jgi:hypothetical protein
MSNPDTVTPTEYNLHGDGVSVTYYPEGTGPVREGRGRLTFAYQDRSHALSFYGDEVRTVSVPDLGTVVSVTTAQSTDTGNTSISLLVPTVVLPSESLLPITISSELVVTRHLVLAGGFGHPQRDLYSVIALTGTASAGPHPL